MVENPYKVKWTGKGKSSANYNGIVQRNQAKDEN
jgi:hypothetical protein